MPVPTSATSIAGGFAAVSLPSQTWKISKGSNRIVGETNGLEAVSQAVEILLNVDRYQFQIFQPYSGSECKKLIGRNATDAEILLQRYVQEALSTDDRILGIENFSSTVDGDKLAASFDVRTVFGTVRKEMEVDTT